MQIIRKSERVECHRYFLDWHRKSVRGAGAYVDCDAQGIVVTAHRERKAEFDADPDLVFDGFKHDRWTYWQPAIGRCLCGAEVELSSAVANTCEKCNRDWSMSGQLFAPRSQWGEETGESLADIFAGDYDPEEIRTYYSRCPGGMCRATPTTSARTRAQTKARREAWQPRIRSDSDSPTTARSSSTTCT